MGNFPVRYDSRVVNYDRRGFIRLATGVRSDHSTNGATATAQKIIFCPLQANV